MSDDFITLKLPKAGGYKTFAVFGITALLGALAVAFPGHIPATTEQQVAAGVDTFAGLLAFFLSAGGIFLRLMTNSPPAGVLNILGLEHKSDPVQLQLARSAGYGEGFRAGSRPDPRRNRYERLSFPVYNADGSPANSLAAYNAQAHHEKLAAELESTLAKPQQATPRPDFADLEEAHMAGFNHGYSAAEGEVACRHNFKDDGLCRWCGAEGGAARLNAENGSTITLAGAGPIKDMVTADAPEGTHDWTKDELTPVPFEVERTYEDVKTGDTVAEDADGNTVTIARKTPLMRPMHSRTSVALAFLIPFLSPSLIPLGMALALSGCATVAQFESIGQAETTGQKAFAAYGAWVTLEKAALRVVVDGRVPAKVRRTVQQAVVVGHPIADAAQKAARAVQAAKAAFEAGTGTQEAMLASTQAAAASLGRLETATSALAVAVNAAGPVIPPAVSAGPEASLSAKDTFQTTN